MRVPLPMAVKQWLRPLPQWPPIAMREPQAAVSVHLATRQGEFELTRAVVIAALGPLTLAVGLDARLTAALEECRQPRLYFVDLHSGRRVGVLHLQQVRYWSTSGTAIGFFEIMHGAQRCLRWPYRPWNQWLQCRRMRRNADPNNFFMPPQAVQQQMIFYICPRPVVLVSVDDGVHSNLFPMDLIGPIAADRYTLALRSTSPSIATMKSARRVVLSDVPARDYATAYQLGVHHKGVKVEWDRLPFEVRRSTGYSLPYPAMALRVRELEILDFDSVGSHTFFVTRIASEQIVCSDAQFFHTSGIYQHFRTRQGRPFASCG